MYSGGPVPQDDKDLIGGESGKGIGLESQPEEHAPVEGGDFPESGAEEPSGIEHGGSDLPSGMIKICS